MASDEESRKGVRDMCGIWCKKLSCDGDVEKQWFYKRKFIEKLRTAPIAIETDTANEQHYEVPTEFYLTILGKRLKYSGCVYPEGKETLEEAEEISLAAICEKAKIEDGQKVMDLGCGWGAFGLYVLEKFPNCSVTTVSNSRTQREHIEGQGKERGFGDRLTCITADANQFSTEERFDRIISVEMFEHMKNYEKLFERVSSWLKADGLLFTQILCHRDSCYHFDTKQDSDTEWMAQHFFSGGTMPSADLFLFFQKDVVMIDHWRINGKNYTRTLDQWLERLDQNKDKVTEIMSKTYGDEAEKQITNWRMFFMFCSEVFGHDNGNQWIISQHLFQKRN